MIHNIPQPTFEQFVAEQLAGDTNVEIRKGIAFVSCVQVIVVNRSNSISTRSNKRQDHDEVITTVEECATKARYRIRSRNVIGCDGAKSEVRKSLGIECEGEDSCTFLITNNPTHSN